MNAPLLDAKINYYQEKIDTLDTMAKTLPESERVNYKSARRRFEQRLEAWQQTLGSDLAVFDNNVKDGYHELEAIIINHKK